MSDNKAIANIIRHMADALATLRVDSTGGELVIGRTVVDLHWLSRKIEDERYQAHFANHLATETKDAMQGLKKCIEGWDL